MKNKRPEYAQYRLNAAELCAHANTFKDRQLEVTFPIYLTTQDGIPDLVGSCVLIQLASARFLVTAGHVLDKRRIAPLLLGVSPDFASLSGEVTRIFATPSDSSISDSIDLGVVKLEGGPWGELPQQLFLEWHELDIRAPLAVRHSFALLGFPVNRNRDSVRGEHMTAEAYGVAGLECGADSYVEAGVNPETSLMLGFVKKDVWGLDGKRTAPDLHGVSGCGVWRYGRYIREARKPPLLSAIAVEWHRKRQPHYILATRIHLVIATLADRYSEVADYVRAQFPQPH